MPEKKICHYTVLNEKSTNLAASSRQYLADDNIIRASIVMQFLVPFLHHSTLAGIVSLQSPNYSKASVIIPKQYWKEIQH